MIVSLISVILKEEIFIDFFLFGIIFIEFLFVLFFILVFVVIVKGILKWFIKGEINMFK